MIGNLAEKCEEMVYREVRGSIRFELLELAVWIRQTVPIGRIAETTRSIRLAVREAPNDGMPSFGSNR
jgi:hypothetical protein